MNLGLIEQLSRTISRRTALSRLGAAGIVATVATTRRTAAPVAAAGPDALPAAQASPVVMVAPDLTGIWECNDGLTYYLRVVAPDEMFWVGMSQDDGKTLTNAFHGTIIGSQVGGDWADVPRGARATGSGSIILSIESSSQLSKVYESTGIFTGSTWTRVH